MRALNAERMALPRRGSVPAFLLLVHVWWYEGDNRFAGRMPQPVRVVDVTTTTTTTETSWGRP